MQPRKLCFEIFLISSDICIEKWPKKFKSLINDHTNTSNYKNIQLPRYWIVVMTIALKILHTNLPSYVYYYTKYKSINLNR